jgi:hypothetical protein
LIALQKVALQFMGDISPELFDRLNSGDLKKIYSVELNYNCKEVIVNVKTENTFGTGKEGRSEPVQDGMREGNRPGAIRQGKQRPLQGRFNRRPERA